MSNQKSFSQYGQDKYLDRKVFKGKENGVFIEIGAYDGIHYSNTYFFETFRNWTGICVEPNPNVFKELSNNRSCITINKCISDDEKLLEFVQVEGYAEMLSGLKDKYDSRHVERIENDLKNHGGSKKIIEVPAIRLDKLIDDHDFDHIDYCSIDTEGGEMEIISTIDLTKYPIEVLSIENNYYVGNLKKLMKSLGYNLKTIIECDEIYVKRKKRWYFFN